MPDRVMGARVHSQVRDDLRPLVLTLANKRRCCQTGLLTAAQVVPASTCDGCDTGALSTSDVAKRVRANFGLPSSVNGTSATLASNFTLSEGSMFTRWVALMRPRTTATRCSSVMSVLSNRRAQDSSCLIQFSISRVGTETKIRANSCTRTWLETCTDRYIADSIVLAVQKCVTKTLCKEAAATSRLPMRRCQRRVGMRLPCQLAPQRPTHLHRES